MTRLAWRLHRWQILGTVGITVVLTAIMVIQRVRAAGLIDDSPGGVCPDGSSAGCRSGAENVFNDTFLGYLTGMDIALLVVPVLLGLWCGAGLFADEFQRNTAGFVLTQSTSRRRWLVTKLAVVAGPLAGSMIVLGLVSLWTLEPMRHHRMVSILSEEYFPTMGTMPAGLAVLTFAVAAVAGLWSRNVVLSLAVGLIATAGIFLATTQTRSGYFPAEEFTAQISADSLWGPSSLSSPQGTWFIDLSYYDESGDDVTSRFESSCFSGSRIESILECATEVGAVTVESRYHPPSHFWPLQLVETGLYLVLAAAVIALGDRVLHRRDIS